jgi:hypothetical protein
MLIAIAERTAPSAAPRVRISAEIGQDRAFAGGVAGASSHGGRRVGRGAVWLNRIRNRVKELSPWLSVSQQRSQACRQARNAAIAGALLLMGTVAQLREKSAADPRSQWVRPLPAS